MEVRIASGRSDRRAGQALLETLVVLPVLLLLLLAASDMAKLFAVSGKCEIAARYGALRLARGGAFVPNTASELERVFFQGTLDDREEEASEPADVRTDESDMSMRYRLPDGASEFWQELWPWLWATGIEPVRRDRVAFEYDLVYFPYRTGQGLPEEEDLSTYQANGEFVAQANAFAGPSGEEVRLHLLGNWWVVPFAVELSELALILYLLAILFP
ncbi:MAG: hypothetical protein AB1640_11255 [bacterium]